MEDTEGMSLDQEEWNDDLINHFITPTFSTCIYVHDIVILLFIKKHASAAAAGDFER